MRFFDAVGQDLQENDVVVLTVEGQLVTGTVAKLNHGLGLKDTPDAQPTILVSVLRGFVAAPTGQVASVVSLAKILQSPAPAST